MPSLGPSAFLPNMPNLQDPKVPYSRHSLWASSSGIDIVFCVLFQSPCCIFPVASEALLSVYDLHNVPHDFSPFILYLHAVPLVISIVDTSGGTH